MLANFFESGGWEGFTRLVVAASTEVIVGGRERQAMSRSDGVEDFEAFSDNFGSDAITGDYSEIYSSSHGVRLQGGMVRLMLRGRLSAQALLLRRRSEA
jgi:hypothetical protein